LEVIVSQRLVRKICKHCITSYTLKDKEIKLLEQAHDISFETITKMIAKTENASKKENDPKGMLFLKARAVINAETKVIKEELEFMKFLI